jgi:uncharacterized repeat protein (TIGR01451 family)
MTGYRTWFAAAAFLALATGLANAQVGVATGGSGGAFACSANVAGAPQLRQESYTELLGDIVISCTGGLTMPAGSAIPTTNITVYVFSAVSLTSRFLDTSGASEALLLVDEPGSGTPTGVAGNYGPKAPQTFCSTAQQQQAGGSACGLFVGTDPGTSGGPYQVAVSTSGGSIAAANVYQGKVGDFGAYSVTFYSVPVLPPALHGVSRTYRITNLRIPTAGMAGGSSISAVISTNGPTTLPVGSPSSPVGIIGNAMMATVDPAPPGGASPFSQCVAPQGAALAARVHFTEGFATMFKTRVVPLTNATWASTVPNAGTPGQNIPGGVYGGFFSNNESGFILPSATGTVGTVTYTAGLTDFGTRLKAVFTNIPSGVQLYVSTTNASSYSVPGGTGTAPYAVLVGSSQSNDATNDGAVIAPLTAGTVAGSDGLTAYPLTPDGTGTAAAIWEVVNANPGALDTLTFSVYIGYNGTPAATTQPGFPASNVALSFAPEPGGGSFTTINATGGLITPVPRDMILTPQQGSWVAINACSINASSTATVPFTYVSGGTAPASQTVTVSTTPAGLTVTATPAVTTPAQGTWLSASLSGGTLTISANPSGLAPSATAYTGSVTLSATGMTNVVIPVTLTVYPPPSLSIGMTNAASFEQGQQGASYTITVSNAAGAGSTSGTVKVTEQPPSGLTLATMGGTGWNCATLPTCTRNDTLAGGNSYPQIAVTVNVSATAASPQVNGASLSYGGSVVANATDSTTILPPPVLGVTLRHSGNFVQGQTNAVYTVTVSNTAAASPTNAPVTVTETIPTGLTLVSMAGTGWTCGGNTCSSQNALPALSSYYPITVTVNAAANAPIYVTNQVTVAGGGALSPASASDVTLVDTPAVQYVISTYAGGFPAPTAAVATNYALNGVSSVAIDQFGNTYLISGLDCVFKADPAGNLTRVAGTCRPGYSGDGGPAVQAQLNYPRGLAVDSAGNLYIADQFNNRIRKVDASGIITTVVGTGAWGYNGDNIPATSAQLYSPQGICLDTAGNLYIADFGNFRIRKVTGGIISTVAGSGAEGDSGDGAAAISAALYGVAGVAVDSAGNLYIADSESNRVRAVGLNGIINTVAGTGVGGYSGDGGQAISAQLNQPWGLAVSAAGYLYIADLGNNRVRSVSPGGTIQTVAGNGNNNGLLGDGWPAISATISVPEGVSVDATGNLYIADTGNERVRKVTPAGIISTIAGNGVYPYFFGDGGPATLAGFGNRGIAVDTADNLYVADSDNNRLREISASGTVTTIAGTGIYSDSGDGGPAISAGVATDVVAVDSMGNVYIGGFARVRKIATNGVITTVVGNGTYGYSGDNGPATSAVMAGPPSGLAVDTAGNLYISDANNQRIRKVTPEGIITTVAGTGGAGYSGDGGPGTSAELNYPAGLAADAAGNLYIADNSNLRVRKLAPDGTISTVAGNGIPGNAGDGGPATSAQLYHPLALAVDSAGDLYIGSQYSAVRKVSRGGFISTIAGTGNGGYSGDGGPAVSAQLGESYGLAVDSSGRVYVSDNGNTGVRILQPVGLGSLLAVSQTHSGNFAWGQTGAAYAITVTNAALAGPTTGTVTLTEVIPSGLTLVSMAGSGWSCSGNICSRGDPLGAGASYPPVTLIVNVAANALPQVTPAATVSGGGSPQAAAEDPTFVGATQAVLGIVSTHTGNFTQAQTNATYTLTVSNLAGAPTSGTVTVTENLPTGLTLGSMAGTAWACVANSCTRSDGLVSGAQYPTITVTVSVASNAPLLVTNKVSVDGGNSAIASASDPTNIYSTTPVLTIASTHSGSPTPGQNATYTLTVGNSALAVATSGTVTVTENLPAGLTLVSMSAPGTNWSCSGSQCWRSDSLLPGASYDAITVTAAVAQNAASQVTNQAAASGGGALSPATASDLTNIGGLVFYPLTPCRVADTRAFAGFTGTQGPPYVAGGTSRNFGVAGYCGVPANATAYSLNVTVVPRKPVLDYLTTWPTGQPMPNASTLNSWTGTAVANAALVPAGTNGDISIYASDDTEVLFDINGYFAPPTPSGLQFYPLTPCRVADTRGFGFTGTQGAPALAAGTSRNFQVSGLCGVPLTAAAYSLNVTVVPSTGSLDYLTAWPTGQPMPNASTLNSWTGTAVANAAMVPAGTNGDISIFASDATNVLFDINGYYAPAGTGGSDFYPMTPCRVADTRAFAGFTEQFGAPSMGAGTSRSFAVQSSVCNVPTVAAAYSLNVTVVPQTDSLDYLTTWPTGLTQPNASTLNSWTGTAVANAAVVPAGTGTGGPIDIYASDPTDVLFDISGYFGPGQ